MPCMCQTKEEFLKSEYEFTMLYLCKACKFLTKEQMISIKRDADSADLFFVYKNHIHADYNCESVTEEEKIICINEAKRLGFTIKQY